MTSEPLAEKSLIDTVVELADQDEQLDDGAKYLVLAALESDQALDDQLGGAKAASTPAATVVPDETRSPAGAFVTEISVAGFRGIGERATLRVHPAPGITVVSGRNGSGKSSFAEALELAITGDSYRWHNKASLWSSSWRNLHTGSPCEVRIKLAVEGSPELTVGVDWKPEATLEDRSVWTQYEKQKKSPGLAQLGWASATELYRPILSYDEIGGLFDGRPSVLYDALAKLLGLEAIYAAETRLAARYKAYRAPRQASNDALKSLKVALASSTDSRAMSASDLVKSRTADLDAVERIATGTSPAGEARVDDLKAIVGAQRPDVLAVENAASTFREALSVAAESGATLVSLADRQSTLLRAALDVHEISGDTDCPVCRSGRLDADWREAAATELAANEAQLSKVRDATSALNDARADLVEQLRRARPGSFTCNDVEGMEAYTNAKSASEVLPDDGGLADFAIEHAATLADAFEALLAEATEALVALEAEWTPLAAELARWVDLEREARKTDDAARRLSAAKTWVTKNAASLRNLRLKPLAEEAREIWSELRQESNVDLAAITLEGTNTTRRVSLEAAVDGEPTGALSVMSQGELHALALALFIPRATAQRSPFRFLVLDDPIQAMDPAKVEGFVKVLARIAKTRQVVVFSHDDRLATAIRNLAVDARLVEVNRASESRVRVVEAASQASRYASDAHAIIADENVSDDIKKRAAPVIFRLAIEAVARDVYFRRSYQAGVAIGDVETEWESASRTRQKLALAVHSDMTADTNGWLSHRAHRRPTLTVCNAGAHAGAAAIDLGMVRDLRATIRDISELT